MPVPGLDAALIMVHQSFHPRAGGGADFKQHWVCVGHLSSLTQPGSFMAGEHLGMPFVVTRST